ncbi:MAG TPA: hypothetical protein VOB72_10365 [Candidatus Dormibacteraeota bacterium]|nr:hypothetical protein [Candidatus Dormibacteraeota bacterium]
MNRDDRELVREVFARTQAPAAPDLGRRVRARVEDERRRRLAADGGWLLLVAGGALALMMAVGVLIDGGALPLPAPSGVAPAPQADALASSPPGDAATFVAGTRRLDWSGRPAGAFTPPAGAPAHAVSPDGALMAVPTAGDGADVLDAGGRLVGRLPAFGAWSGDGAHVACGLVPGGFLVADLRDPAHLRLTATALAHGSGWTLAGCSAGTDLLAAVRQERDGAGRYGVAEAMLVRMSVGRVVTHLDYADGPPPAGPVLSHDARYLAENDPDRSAAGMRDLVTGEVVGHVSGVVVAFSGDDRLVLTDSELGAPADASRATLVDWRWRRTVWAGAGHAEPLAVRPGGRQLALTLATAAGTRTLLVDGDAGRALDLDGREGPQAA